MDVCEVAELSDALDEAPSSVARVDGGYRTPQMTIQRELREAHRLFLEMGAPIRAAEVATELGL